MSETQGEQFTSQKKTNTNFYALNSQLPEKQWNSKLPSLLTSNTNNLLLNDLSGLQQQPQDLSIKTSSNQFAQQNQFKFSFGNKNKTLFIAGQNQLNQFKFGEKGFANQNSNEEIQEKKNKIQLLSQIQKTLVAMNKAPAQASQNQAFTKQQNNEFEFNTSNPQVLQFQHQFRQLKTFAQEAKQKFLEKCQVQQQPPQPTQLTKKIIPNINFHKQSYFQQLCNQQNNKEKPLNSISQLFSPNNVITIKKISPSKMSFKKHGIVHAFAANTHQGIIRKSNEDRVSIVLNIKRPENKPLSIKWPQCSYFAIYDGHGGATTAEFLKDNLHQYIIKDAEFPDNPKQAILNGFAAVDNYFLAKAQELIQNKKEEIDLSGSCAISILIVDKIIYVANLGDSRAILSSNDCQLLTALSQDHKPMLEQEKQRILKAGGEIYQNPKYSQQCALVKQQIPFRIMPSHLNVSRTLGDVSSKLIDLGGRPGVILGTPEIYTLHVDRTNNFIFLGSDGIFDRVSNELILEIARKDGENNETSVHERAARLCENVIKEAVARRSADNLTAVVVVLPGWIKQKKEKRIDEEKI